MRDRRWQGIAASVCLGLAGCFSPGPFARPTSYSLPPHTAMAPQPIYPGAPPAGAVWVPASPSSNPAVPTINAPPAANKPKPAATDSIDDSGAGRSVPEPREPSQTQPLETTQPFGINGETVIERRGVRTSQNSNSLRSRTNDTLAPIPSDSEYDAAELVAAGNEGSSSRRSPLRSADFTMQVQAEGVTPIPAPASVYGYDTEAFTWLKGRVEFDRTDQTWHLIYNTTPDGDDPYGGEITFKQTADFSVLKAREAVQVEGRIDPNERDRLGKPVYEVERLTRAAPKPR